MSNPEVIKPSGERGAETSEAAGEQLKKLHEQLEKKGEQSPDQNSERAEARHKIEGLFSKESGKEKRSGGEPTSSPASRHASKQQREQTYKATMKQIRSEMNIPSRAFSKVIHNKMVEKTSDFVATTAARPNAVLAGSICASLLTLAMYTLAKRYGYSLSGFETIATFGLGWALGVIYDYTRLLVSGKRN